MSSNRPPELLPLQQNERHQGCLNLPRQLEMRPVPHPPTQVHQMYLVSVLDRVDHKKCGLGDREEFLGAQNLHLVPPDATLFKTLQYPRDAKSAD